MSAGVFCGSPAGAFVRSPAGARGCRSTQVGCYVMYQSSSTLDAVYARLAYEDGATVWQRTNVDLSIDVNRYFLGVFANGDLLVVSDDFVIVDGVAVFTTIAIRLAFEDGSEVWRYEYEGNRPGGAEVHQGNDLVAIGITNGVLVLNPDGTLGREYSIPGASRVAIDADNNVWVNRSGNVVEGYDDQGALHRTWTYTNTQGSVNVIGLASQGRGSVAISGQIVGVHVYVAYPNRNDITGNKLAIYQPAHASTVYFPMSGYFATQPKARTQHNSGMFSYAWETFPSSDTEKRVYPTVRADVGSATDTNELLLGGRNFGSGVATYSHALIEPDDVTYWKLKWGIPGSGSDVRGVFASDIRRVRR